MRRGRDVTALGDRVPVTAVIHHAAGVAVVVVVCERARRFLRQWLDLKKEYLSKTEANVTADISIEVTGKKL